ncbi:hypothetical protein [Chitinophaga nivalis]|uniref:Uncharacterized protein n=1 Tax=Chitinophaga nivalis TaxID=2991709 RepID=A0ABT3IIT3_9BACT|nr:hypothetical protein [Chitinophaga nivalis]MCW3466437.1 hypothetical protein [Chitinophaga nivalis]MCW3483872.1 hypothetical protein [Chitinophaga nivalis]
MKKLSRSYHPDDTQRHTPDQPRHNQYPRTFHHNYSSIVNDYTL